MASKKSAAGRKQSDMGVLTCRVCLERYRSPKLLPCFHTFCQRCVEKLAGSKPSLACPACRTVTVIPPGGVRDLQTNFYIEKDLAQQESETGHQCELCGEGKQAKHRCVECQQLYCGTCRQTHDAIQSCLSHTVLPLGGEAGGGQGDEKKCPKHKNQPQLLFCCQCQVSICMQCKLTSHDGHETEDVVDTGKKARTQLTQQLATITQREQVLQAILARADDFQEDLRKEKRDVETAIRARTEEVKKMADQAQQEALETVSSTVKIAVKQLKEQTTSVKKAQAAVTAKRQFIRQVVDRGDDTEAVAMVAQMKKEEDEEQGTKSSKTREDVALWRVSVRHEFKSRAVKYADVLAFVGMAREGPVMETKARSLEAESLHDSVKPQPQQSSGSQLAFRRHTVSKDGTSSFVEVVYSKNPKSVLTSMHLSADETVWLNFNPGGSVPLLAQFDDEGRRLEVRYENIPESALLVTCEEDTVVCLSDGRWVRHGGESGVLQNFTAWSGQAVSKSATPLLLSSSAIYRLTSTALPPQVEPNPAFSFNIGAYSFDVSADGQFFAFAYSNTAYVYDKLQSSTSLRQFATYSDPSGQAANDVCFCFMEGEEMLLVTYSVNNTVLVLDHKDGCCLIRTLETDQCPLTTPCRLATNHQGRVWVGCNGGKVVIFDV